MDTKVYTDVNRRHDFVLLFDVADGNPNGDPDAGNLPRVDPETMQGLVTDVCLKRKVRNWVEATSDNNERSKIYVEHHGVLNVQHQRAYTALGKTSTGAKQDRDTVSETRRWMCENFYDIRMFGAVMTTGVNCGQVRGPVQLTFARSVDAIVPLDLSITRVAVTDVEDAKRKETEMGRKQLIPYGLYRGYGFFTPHFAEQTGATAEDLDLFWRALLNMWDLDRSASRGMMACRGLYVFSHDSKLGNAPAQALFERVKVQRKDGVEAPRRFSDYIVTVDNKELPGGVELSRIVG